MASAMETTSCLKQIILTSSWSRFPKREPTHRLSCQPAMALRTTDNRADCDSESANDSDGGEDVTFTSDPNGAEIYVDGKFVGKRPPQSAYSRVRTSW